VKYLEVVVVGSGPSALATVRELYATQREINITVLDPGNIAEPSLSMGLKSYFGSLHMYDQQDLNHEEMRPVTWPSASKGGFTRIWGAVIGVNPEPEFLESINFSDGKNREFTTLSRQRILKSYQARSDTKWKLEEHIVAVNPKLCIMCGNCLTGCPTNAIWFAGDYWQEFSNLKFVGNFKVSHMEKILNKVKIYSEQHKSIDADLVFIAAGPISSAKILMRSKLITTAVSFSDTQALFFPALRLPVNEEAKSFALSQISARLNWPTGGMNYLQLYPDSRNLINSIQMHKPLFGKLISGLWRAISPFVVTGIWYRDSKFSPVLKLKMTIDGEFILSKNLDNERRAPRFLSFKISRRIFSEFRILPIFSLGKIAEAGESYHFGASAEIANFNKESLSTNIKVVDASAMSEIIPGPITNSVMKQAKWIVSETLKAIK